MEKLKIGFIHPKAPSTEGTGANHSATKIISTLEQQGHSVTVYCKEKIEQKTSFDTRQLRYDGSFPNQQDEALNRTLRDRKEEFGQFDIVHSYLMQTIPALTGIDNTNTIVTLNAYGGVCPKNTLRYLNRRECGRNGVVRCAACTFHQQLTDPTDGDMGLFSRILETVYHPIRRLRRFRLLKQGERNIESIDAFQALSTHVKETYADFGFPADRIQVIPNISDKRFLVDHQSDFRPPYQLLYVGFLEKQKGVERLVPLISRLHNHGIDAEFTIVGGGTYKSKLERQIKARGLQSATDVTGHIAYESLPEIYATHDLFVYPGTWNEPFGRVFLEALAAGTPIVATDVGATKEIVDNGGKVVENSIEGLLNGIIEMIKSGNLATYSSNATISRYRQETVIEQIEQLYYNALG